MLFLTLETTMNVNCLDNYFENWIAEKESINCINNVYGQAGLMAIVNFIQFIKEKENANNYSYRKSGSGNQADYSRTEFRAREGRVAS